ncbi:MAG TPA: fimbria/pilus outer membrane usher protein, partial [Caulobacteraceae bacterium]|nr:fimbria/pilus outer membrane usher protein [Caulobacteraceae bacterium]
MARAVKRSRWRRLSLIAAAATTIAACPALAADEPVGHQPVIVEVSINGLAAGRDIYALRDAEGRIYVRLADLKAWRIKAAPPSAPLIFESQHYAPLHDIPGLTYAFTEQSQLLQVQASADIFEMSTLGARRRNLGPMTRPRAGAFLNYDLYGQTGVEGDSLGGLLELGAFAGGASGTTTLLGRSYDGGSELVRLESTWTIDNPETMRFLRFGDSIARGSASTPPFRFGGVQWGTNFAIRPGFLMMPTPTMQGSAALPSTVDIYVNDVLTARERAPAGPFEITTPPILSGDGVVRMVIEDVLGRQTEQTLQYYSGPGLLAAGLHDYSYEAGFLRQDFGARSFSYKDAFVAGTHRYGVSNSLTAELHGEISSRAQLIGGSATTLLPFGGVATLSAAASRR